ncbi:MLX-interacting protein isoform X2 [Contarinia nasturtii]|nr:MLX-interacting protein isoform X2 [Contarinia nasturtii]
MQFIMKKKTLVCQFASPLDVDLHSKPESVVLEGKYWKRQFDVIKAEYMKWRKFYRNRGLANAILDTVSEIDIFDWSPATSDKNLMSIDDYCWTADTLFSTINSTPFPFPDPREIAKAGIADFIQPSLGPLQPNLEDFMNELPLQELINSHLSSRLPPVPEESSDDGMYRGDISYDFPAIMESEPMDSSMIQQTTISDVTNLNARDQLSDSLICASSARTMQQSQNSANMLPFNTQSQASILPYQGNQAMPPPMNQLTMSRSGNVVPSQIQTQSMLSQSTPYMSASTNQAVIQSQNVDLSNLTGAKKRIPIKERGLRSQLFGRREPHNYDKSTPTQHQTNLYNQMLAQQNRTQLQIQQQQQQNQLNSSMSGVGGTTIYNSTNYLGSQNVQSPIQTTTNTYANALNLTSNNTFNVPQNQMNANVMNMMQNSTQQPQMASQTQTSTAKSSSNLLSLLSMKSTSNASDIDISQLDPYKMTTTGSPTNAYKPYSLQQSMKSASYQQLSQRNLQSVATQMNQQQQPQQLSVNTAAMDKELFRSKSLPMNSTLQLPVMREESFVVPKYQASKSTSTSNRIRARSNSMISKQQHHSTPSLQSAASEPMLKTLAQLLTSPSNSGGGSSSVTNLQQSNVLQNANVVTPNEITMSQTQQKKQINQFQSQFSTQFSQPLSPDNKFVGSPSAGVSLSQLSPGSSGESMQRRVGHIHAEQKRRYNIKNGFDMLHTLIPTLHQNPNAKLSKAAMLQKGAEYIKQLRAERDAVNQKMDTLRKERDALNNSLNHLHSVLPANGAPVSRQRTSRVKEMYTEYVREKTLQNWKFWILGLIFEPLLNSYNSTVSVASMDELYRSAMIWVDQHCSLVEIRPAVSDKLRYLSTTTDILSDPPSTLQEEVLKAISSNNVGSSTNLL